MISRRRFVMAGGALALAWPAAAQTPPKVPRVGILRLGSSPDPFLDAFREGLRELGYIEGRTIVLDYRWAEGREERLRELAADLVAQKPDVLVVGGGIAVQAARQATTTIPIVMPVVTDPVALGVVKSLARPGGNVTGFVSPNDALAGKWVGLVREAFPKIARVGLLLDPLSDYGQSKGTEAAARTAGIRLHVLTIHKPEDLVAAFARAEKQRVEAVIVSGSPVLFAQRAAIVGLAARHRMPALYHNREFVVGLGGLMSYGADFHDLFRRAAILVDKILKGARPADLPIEQPSKYELVVNLKTAKALGVTLPHSFLLLANEVIQ
ncbi:MAG: ABC transporter substrate-binding protein [Candidatus Rokubacteria bacterium]|nr:ABC transporter substrate-binding protein [Candidatus Rokubacteria bacterium]